MRKAARFCAFVLGVMAATAHATPVFDVSVYSVPQSAYLPPDTGTARTFPKAIAAGIPTNLVVTLQVGGLDTVAAGSGTIQSGIDAFFTGPTNIVGSTTGSFQDTLWHVTGYIEITQEANTFATSGNNDGLRLTVGGNTVIDIQGGTPQTTNINLQTGPKTFELYYWNGAAGGNYNFTINGLGAVSAAIPEPGAFALVALGLGLLIQLRRVS